MTPNNAETSGEGTAYRGAQRALPTDRIAFLKQLDLLRAFAIKSGDGRMPVKNKDVAKLAELSPATVSNANPFFNEVGLLTRVEGGNLPSDAVFDFAKAFDWDKDTATAKLAPVLKESWFGQALLQRLKFRPMQERDAVSELGQLAGVGKARASQVRLLLEYIAASGLVTLADGMVSVAARAEGTPPPTSGQSQEVRQDRSSSPKDPFGDFFGQTPKAKPEPLLFRRRGILVEVDETEFANWSEEGIREFFGAIATLLVAKREQKDADTAS